MKRSLKIVFIGHEASLSGAPILLLNLLRLLKENMNMEITVVVRRYGPLLNEYERHFKVILLKGENYSNEKKIYKRVGNILRNRFNLIRVFWKALLSDVVFSNTITNGLLLKSLSLFKRKTITYVHELENVVEWYMPLSGYSFQYSEKFAYPSQKVANVLEKSYNVSIDKLVRLSYYFPFNSEVTLNSESIENFKASFKKRFSIKDQFIVGNVGVLCKRKGSDLFMEVCSRVVKINPDIKFCWIGSFEDNSIEVEIRELIKSKSISDNVILTGPLEHHYYNFCNFDLLFLSSREDPYPLVVIESAFMKIPTMCFKDSGGITEFVDNDSGWVINEFSVSDAASKILQLYNDKKEIEKKGGVALEKALRIHSDKNRIIEQFTDLVSSIA
jgi:glycosyltransferase involved in cell wall biosynthesis